MADGASEIDEETLEEIDLPGLEPGGVTKEAPAPAPAAPPPVAEPESLGPSTPFKKHPNDLDTGRIMKIEKLQAELDKSPLRVATAHGEDHAARLQTGGEKVDLSAKQHSLLLERAKEDPIGGSGSLQCQGVHWEGSNLRGVHLEFADLTRANLREANLSEAHLDGASVESANLSHANLSKATLREACAASADMRDVNASHADMLSANLSRADMTNANLSHSELSHANLRWCTLAGADLRHANLSHAVLYGANLSDAKLDGCDLSYANIGHASLCGARLEGVRLEGVVLDGETDLTGAEPLSDETNARLEKARGLLKPLAPIPTAETHPDFFGSVEETNQTERIIDGVKAALKQQGGAEKGWCEGVPHY